MTKTVIAKSLKELKPELNSGTVRVGNKNIRIQSSSVKSQKGSTLDKLLSGLKKASKANLFPAYDL